MTHPMDIWHATIDALAEHTDKRAESVSELARVLDIAPWPSEPATAAPAIPTAVLEDDEDAAE